VKHLYKSFPLKLISLLLIFFLIHGDMLLFPQTERLEKLFLWAKMDFNSGKYRDVAGDLELILSYYGKEGKEDKKPGRMKLKGKIYLLLGATYEHLGRIPEAKEHYKSAKLLLDKEELKFPDVYLDDLTQYRQIVLEEKSPSPLRQQKNVIERPIVKPRKKKRTFLILLAAGVVIAGTITALMLTNKKNSSEVEIDEDFDTHNMGIQWISIPPGEYLLGDNFNEGDPDELPVHAVYQNGYSISKYEVTFTQFLLYLRERRYSETPPSDEGWGMGERPVINVTWESAYQFCEWLSEKTGKNIHLPTEAQWEIAARGTTQSRFPWGNSPVDCFKANYNCDIKTHPVGSHPEGVSPFGVYDMAGNVSEWCYDLYNDDYYQRSPYTDPFNRPPNVSYQWVSYVIRGGSWNTDDSSQIRSSDRSFGRHYWGATVSAVSTSNNHLGFRIVKE